MCKFCCQELWWDHLPGEMQVGTPHYFALHEFKSPSGTSKQMLAKDQDSNKDETQARIKKKLKYLLYCRVLPFLPCGILHNSAKVLIALLIGKIHTLTWVLEARHCRLKTPWLLAFRHRFTRQCALPKGFCLFVCLLSQ